jgi:hypothetical protein
MKTDWLKIAVGQQALPDNARDLYDFVQYAEREHIMGQVAVQHLDRLKNLGRSTSKLKTKLENAFIRSEHDKRMLEFEANRIERALVGMDIHPILLKGGAYVVTRHPVGRGRRVSDLDIMVDEGDLRRVENALIMAGWRGDAATDNDYDQAYYRKWMHELPPMRHQHRRTLIDVHHRLTPKTARVELDHQQMQDKATVIEGRNLKAFTPTDRFLHAIYHIFYDGELDTPARSLIEVFHLFDGLTPDEIGDLPVRAREVGAYRPLLISLMALSKYYQHKRAQALLEGVNIPISLTALMAVFDAQIRGSGVSKLAKMVLYIRGHWLRMPLLMLLKHLTAKTFRKREKQMSSNFLEDGFLG